MKKDWKKVLSEEKYKVLREKETEPAFAGELLDNKKLGVYSCGACNQKLFSSESTG